MEQINSCAYFSLLQHLVSVCVQAAGAELRVQGDAV